MPLSRRGIQDCRGCARPGLVSILDLGSQPIANEFPSGSEINEARFPLHLRFCQHCGLGQVGEFERADRLFGDDYPYFSSMSHTWLQHSKEFAESKAPSLLSENSSYVLEIASNDGYLLREFMSKGLQVLGVEPAGSVADVSRTKGIPTISEFFGERLGIQIRKEFGAPRLVVANNVVAHVPDLRDFFLGLHAISDSKTEISIENPSFLGLLTESQFDTIYHEHFSYLSATSVNTISTQFGLELFKVEQLPTHGGSYRYWLRVKSQTPRDASVDHALDQENRSGLFEDNLHASFRDKSLASCEELRNWIKERKAEGRRVVCYGAAAKGNTLLNAAGVTFEEVDFVVDKSPGKIGRFLPGSKIPVISPEDMMKRNFDDVLILPWNIKAEIASAVSEISAKAKCWVVTPSIQLVE